MAMVVSPRLAARARLRRWTSSALAGDALHRTGLRPQPREGAAASKAGCPKPKPGATAGGCAFDGAMITLVPIVDAAHVVHGPIACAGNSWDGRRQPVLRPDAVPARVHQRHYRARFVFGGEQKLYDTVAEVVERHPPGGRVRVLRPASPRRSATTSTRCARAAAAAAGLPVIPVHAPGFAGSKNIGNRLAGEALLRARDRHRRAGVVAPTFDVNLVGEYNIAGELWDVTPVLSRLGIRVRACISGDARYRDVAAAHRAKATMVVCSRALLALARGLEERYGIPWFEGSFYGIRAMCDTLRGFAQVLGGDGLARSAEELIATEEACAAAALAPYRERLRGAKAVLYTGGVKSWSVISALQDIGVEVVASGATKSTDERCGQDLPAARPGRPGDHRRQPRRTAAAGPGRPGPTSSSRAAATSTRR